MKLTHVLEPIRVNGVEIKNRIFRPGHGTYYGLGEVTDRLIAYHEARARSGVGLSTLEVCCVHPSTASNRTLYGWDDSIIAGFRRISDAVHRHGMKLFVQIWHGGHHWPGLDGSPSWSPSTVPSPWGFVPVAMDAQRIAEVIAAFAATARRAQEGGLDGVELHFGHGYLVHQFFSPITNKREDAYGGSLENRMRFGRECLRAVRGAVSADFPVGIRISDARVPGGVTPQECAAIVSSYVEEGLVDFVNGSMGSYYDVPSMLPAMDTPTGSMLPSSGPIVAAAQGRVVTMIAGRYRTLEEADQAIREGTADMVGINRAMIADADFFAKSLAGQAERVRPCIGCNQGCVGGILAFPPNMECTVNPAVGREETLDERLIEKTDKPENVVVVGGGPAGMEAARIAASAGHRVTLFEAQPRLGGAINLAKRAPKAAQFGDIGVWLEQEIYRLGVDVRLSTYAERDDVLREQPDRVIVATGSVPRMDGVQVAVPGLVARGLDQARVHSSHTIYDVPKDKLGRCALVFDDVGHFEALGIAEYLIECGLEVTFVTRLDSLAPRINAIQRLEPILRRLRQGKFTVRTRSRIIEIGEKDCTLGWLEGDQVERVSADTVVWIGYNDANSELHSDLVRSIDENIAVTVVGDALTPRDLQVAIREGHLAGRAVSRKL